MRDPRGNAESFHMRTMAVKNNLPGVHVEEDRVDPASFGASIIDCADLTVVKDTATLRIPESSSIIFLNNKRILAEAKVSYP